MPKSKNLDSVLENFVVNDDRIFDKLTDCRALRMLAPCLRMTSYHLDTLPDPVLERFSSQRIIFCNPADPLIQITRGFGSGRYFHGQ